MAEEGDECVYLARRGEEWYARLHGKILPLQEEQLAGALCLYVNPQGAEPDNEGLEWKEITESGWLQVGADRLALVRKADANAMFGGLPFDEEKPQKKKRKAPSKPKEKQTKAPKRVKKERDPPPSKTIAEETRECEECVPPLQPATHQTIDPTALPTPSEGEVEAVLPDYAQTQNTPPTP